MEKGKLIISTKKDISTARIIVIAILGASLIFAGIMLIANAGVFRSLSRDFGPFIGIISGIWMILFPIVSVVLFMQRHRSFLMVYEGCLEGTAISNEASSAAHALFTGKDTKLETFTLKYDEILNVGAPDGRIVLYTKYVKYETLAMANRDLAIAEIRKRITTQEEA